LVIQKSIPKTGRKKEETSFIINHTINRGTATDNMDSELSKKVIANLLDQVDELKPPALEGSVGKFSYFPLYAKGLQPTLILAVSGAHFAVKLKEQ
jgi:hypothetical protein